MKPSVTLSVSIACAPAAVAAFVADPRNLPQWAGGLCRSVRQEGDSWRIDTGEGEVGLAFTGPVEYGILDHVVTLAPDLKVFVPMRVVPNDEGSEVLFTLFRQPGITDARLNQDLGLVTADLQTLKPSWRRAAVAEDCRLIHLLLCFFVAIAWWQRWRQVACRR